PFSAEKLIIWLRRDNGVMSCPFRSYCIYASRNRKCATRSLVTHLHPDRPSPGVSVTGVKQRSLDTVRIAALGPGNSVGVAAKGSLRFSAVASAVRPITGSG